MTGDDEIVIQGDVKDDLFEVIPEKWPQVIESCGANWKHVVYIMRCIFRSTRIL